MNKVEADKIYKLATALAGKAYAMTLPGSMHYPRHLEQMQQEAIDIQEVLEKVLAETPKVKEA